MFTIKDSRIGRSRLKDPVSTILRVALINFASYGYEGTSLANIAKDVGIRKASVYSHFKGKDDIFIQVFRIVIDEEWRIIRDCVKDGDDLGAGLYRYLSQLESRFQKNESLCFLLRAGYLPPTHLCIPVKEAIDKFLQDFEVLLLNAFRSCGHLSGERVSILAIAYMGLVDSLQVELLYGSSERFQGRLSALWGIFDQAFASEHS